MVVVGGAEKDGRGRGEDDRRRDRVGCYQRRHAPRGSRLGPEAPASIAHAGPPPPRPPPRPRPQVDRPPPDVAVLRPFPDQPVRLRRFLPHAGRRPHLRRRAGDQRHHVRRHSRRGDDPRRGDARWSHLLRYGSDRLGCLDLH